MHQARYESNQEHAGDFAVEFSGHLDVAQAVAAIAVVLNIVVYSMKTMIPLRMLAITTNVLFIIYAALSGIYPTLILNCILLPLNCVRLYQMFNLIRRIKEATGSEFDMTWLKPFMKKHTVTAGTTLFQKDDKADSMFIVTEGKFRLAETGIEIPVGSVVGELGLLSPDGRRTQTLVCDSDGELMAIRYSDFKQLYFQNPQFGLYFLQLTTKRLFENIGSLESKLAARDVLIPPHAKPAAT